MLKQSPILSLSKLIALQTSIKVVIECKTSLIQFFMSFSFGGRPLL